MAKLALLLLLALLCSVAFAAQPLATTADASVGATKSTSPCDPNAKSEVANIAHQPTVPKPKLQSHSSLHSMELSSCERIDQAVNELLQSPKPRDTLALAAALGANGISYAAQVGAAYVLRATHDGLQERMYAAAVLCPAALIQPDVLAAAGTTAVVSALLGAWTSRAKLPRQRVGALEVLKLVADYECQDGSQIRLGGAVNACHVYARLASRHQQATPVAMPLQLTASEAIAQNSLTAPRQFTALDAAVLQFAATDGLHKVAVLCALFPHLDAAMALRDWPRPTPLAAQNMMQIVLRIASCPDMQRVVTANPGTLFFRHTAASVNQVPQYLASDYAPYSGNISTWPGATPLSD